MNCTPTALAYGGKGASSVCTTIHSGGGGTLPFTGVNLVGIALVAFLLVVLGAFLYLKNRTA